MNLLSKMNSIGIFNLIPDKIYLKMKYRLKMGKKLNLKNPKTFNEKLQWLKLYDRNPLYTKFVDKYEVKNIVAEKIGKEHVIPLLGVYNSFDEIDFDKLPNQFVIKCTHDCGGIFICKDKSKFDKQKAKSVINSHLKTNYYYTQREWPYKNVKPRIIIEKYIVDESNTELKDYKFFCFNGEPEILYVAVDRPHDTKFNFYDLEFNKLPFMQHYKNFDRHIEKPKGFDDMVQFARVLSKDIPHIRVDFYDVNGHVYFGELTMYSLSGFEKFEPEDYDKILGDKIKLPSKKIGKLGRKND